MKHLKVNEYSLSLIIKREKEHRNSVPKDTFDWYIYDNRVRLLEEVYETFEVLDVVEDIAAKAYAPSA